MKIKLALILLLAAVLRFYQLGRVPSGFVNDEAAFGYNAYSLLKTGRDEFGEPWPIIFRSFGEGKLPVYTYLTIPSIAVFGLNEWAIRLPSAVFGVLTVAVVGQWSLLAALVLAAMPWAIHFSRAAFEANAAVFLITLGVWLWQEKHFRWSLVSLTASLFTYSAATVFVPLWAIYEFFRKRNKLILWLFIPWLGLLLLQSQYGRLQGISIFNSQSGVAQRLEQKFMETSRQPLILTRLLHNKPAEFTWDVVRRYSAHFSPEFLFFSGDPNRPRYRAPDTGQLLWLELPFLVIGFYLTAKKKQWWILTWLILAPLPAAITFETPSAIRSILMIVPLALITANGLRAAKSILPILTLLLFFNLVQYLDAYFVHLPVHQPYEWQGGYKELVEKVNQLQPNYDRVLVTDSRGTAYIYWLFYNRVDPGRWQQQSKQAQTLPDKFGFTSINQLDNIYFIGETCPAKIPAAKTLYVCTQENHPQAGFTRFPNSINFDDGQPAFVLFESNSKPANVK